MKPSVMVVQQGSKAVITEGCITKAEMRTCFEEMITATPQLRDMTPLGAMEVNVRDPQRKAITPIFSGLIELFKWMKDNNWQHKTGGEPLEVEPK